MFERSFPTRGAATQPQDALREAQQVTCGGWTDHPAVRHRKLKHVRTYTISWVTDRIVDPAVTPDGAGAFVPVKASAVPIDAPGSKTLPLIRCHVK